jgi:hypothetical protein
MYKQPSRLLAALLLGLSPGLALAGMSTFPGLGEPTFSEADLQAAYGQGRLVGRQQAAGECIGNPANCGCNDGLNPCGITVSSTLVNEFQFGETEPNNHIIGADPLIPEALYWANTPWIQVRPGDTNRPAEFRRDEDWFYVTTIEPNQMMTINFTVPQRVLDDSSQANTSRLSQGWLVSVRDAAGNVYAQFDTRYQLDDPSTANKNESKEIAYPVFLGHVGTYYITVEPWIVDQAGQLVTDPNQIGPTQLDLLSVTFSPYQIAVVMSFSGLDAAPPDVNFHDTEVEPNDNRERANPLATGVTMFGLLRQTNDTVTPDETQFLQDEVDYFVYSSPGLEQVVLAWCGKQECSPDVFWFVEVTKADGTPILSFNTDKAETVNFGLAEPGPYFVEVSFQRTTDANCAVFDPEALECKEESVQCIQLEFTPQEDNPDTPEDESQNPPFCEYVQGDSCGFTEESGATADCIRTDLGAAATSENVVWKWELICERFDRVCLEFEPILDQNALNVEYNFTWWGTKLPPLTQDTSAFHGFLERPVWYQDP